MALVIGHSQTKYFKNYSGPTDNINVFSYLGCMTEDLTTKVEIDKAVPSATISSYSLHSSKFALSVTCYLFRLMPLKQLCFLFFFFFLFSGIIMKICLCYFDLLKPRFYIKNGVCRSINYFSYFCYET